MRTSHSHRFKLYVFILSSLSFIWWSGVLAAPTKVKNYRDFTTWYLARHRVIKLPFRAAVVLDAASYTPLYYHQERMVMPTASLIKLVTAGAVAQAAVDWRLLVSFSELDNESELRPYVDPGDRLALLKLNNGDQVTLEQAFAAMLVGSANNAAHRLARVVTGDRASFLSRMRQIAVSWGMNQTTIDEPTGLSLANTSTAVDLAQAICHALDNFMIQFYSSKPQVSFTTDRGVAKIVSHTVRQLRTNPEKFFGAKTGYLKETGYHLAAGVITPQGKRLCIAVLSSQDRVILEQAVQELASWTDQMYRW